MEEIIVVVWARKKREKQITPFRKDIACESLDLIDYLIVLCLIHLSNVQCGDTLQTTCAVQ